MQISVSHQVLGMPPQVSSYLIKMIAILMIVIMVIYFLMNLLILMRPMITQIVYSSELNLEVNNASDKLKVVVAMMIYLNLPVMRAILFALIQTMKLAWLLMYQLRIRSSSSQGLTVSDESDNSPDNNEGADDDSEQTGCEAAVSKLLYHGASVSKHEFAVTFLTLIYHNKLTYSCGADVLKFLILCQIQFPKVFIYF